jgi:hypothetical protein
MWFLVNGRSKNSLCADLESGRPTRTLMPPMLCFQFYCYAFVCLFLFFLYPVFKAKTKKCILINSGIIILFDKLIVAYLVKKFNGLVENLMHVIPHQTVK